MKANQIGKEGNKVSFELEFSTEEVESALTAAYQKTKNHFRVDGFRPGKAPRSIIEKRYGADVFDDEAVDSLIQKGYADALVELDIDPIDSPQADAPALKRGEVWTAKFTVEVPPEVKVKDYIGVETELIEYPTTDADVEEFLKQGQKRNARRIKGEDGEEKEELPPLDDEFAKDVSEFDTLDELRKQIKKDLKEQNEKRAEAEMKNAIVLKILDANDVEIPAQMVADRLDEKMREFAQRLAQNGIDPEKFYSASQQTEADIRERAKGDAESEVKMRLLLAGIARQEKIEATEEEIKAELVNIAAMFGKGEDAIDEIKESLGPFRMRTVKEDIRNRKTIEYIFENAITSAKKGKKEEKEKKEKE